MAARIAILGGGYAGMAAAVELAAAGKEAVVFEAGKVLGGRARKVALDGRELDNGQHLLIGAYCEQLRLMRRVGIDPDVAFLRVPLQLVVEPDFHLRCPKLPAPLHLVAALAGVRGLGWLARWRLIGAIRAAQSAGWRLATDCPVADWLRQNRQPEELVSRFWQPLTVAALNTPLEKASAQVLLNILRDSLGGDREASDLLLPRVDFSALFPEAAARFVSGRGGEIRLGMMIKSLRRDAGGWQVGESDERFAAVICALPPHRAGMVLRGLPQLAGLADQLETWEYQPIVTVYLQYAAEVRLPRPMTGLADSLAQWVFDRSYTHDTPGLIAVVISAEGSHLQWPREALIDAVEAELHARLGLPAQAGWRGMIAEKRATFACVPAMARPGNATAEPGLWLAGDYTAGIGRDYPATLEGAVRSGVAAAGGVLKSCY